MDHHEMGRRARTRILPPDLIIHRHWTESKQSFPSLEVAVSARSISRRAVLAASAALISRAALGEEPATRPTTAQAEPIIDIHQHTNYSGRSDAQLIAHQRRMGITRTILLPAGRDVKRASTHDGKSSGLAAQCGGNE